MSDRFVYGYRVQVAARQVRSNSLPHPISSQGGDVGGRAGGCAWPVAAQVFTWVLIKLVNSDADVLRACSQTQYHRRTCSIPA